MTFSAKSVVVVVVVMMAMVVMRVTIPVIV
jgi:hypothetical protein